MIRDHIMQFERTRKRTAGNNKQENAADKVGKVFHYAPHPSLQTAVTVALSAPGS